MPADFHLDHLQRVVHSRAWGAVTDADLQRNMASVKQLFGRGELDARWAQIYDFTAADSLAGVSSQGIGYLARETPWPAECPRALVAPDGLRFGLARMYQLVGDQKTVNVQIVNSAAEAAAWIAEVRARRARGDGGDG